MQASRRLLHLYANVAEMRSLVIVNGVQAAISLWHQDAVFVIL